MRAMAVATATAKRNLAVNNDTTGGTGGASGTRACTLYTKCWKEHTAGNKPRIGLRLVRASKDMHKESTFVQVVRIWNESKGNWLLATGLLAISLTATVGYYDLIPEITATVRPNAQSMLMTGNTLTIQFTEAESNQGKIVAMLYEAESFSDQATAQRMESMAISGTQAVWKVRNIPFGKYIVIAFHDLDENGELGTSERKGLSDPPFEFSVEKSVVVVPLQNQP